jgi:hypothetical protein
LIDDGAKLVVRGIGFDVKGKIGVGVAEKYILSDQGFDCLESVILFGAPALFELFAFNLDEFGQGCHNLGTMTPHGTVKVDHADETSKLLESFRFGKSKNRLDWFEPWLQASWSHPITEDVRFLNTPLTFERVCQKSVRMKTAKNSVEFGNVSVPEKIKDAHVVDVAVQFMEHLPEDLLHGCLGPIRRLVESHR